MSHIKRRTISELQPYFIAETSGIRRINRTQITHTEKQAKHLSEKPVQNVQKIRRMLNKIDNCVMLVLLVKNGKLNHHDQELAYVAYALSGKWQNCAVIAVIFGEHGQDLTQWGIDRVIHYRIDILKYYQTDAMIHVLKSAYQTHQPKHILFADDDWGSGDLLRRFAVSEAMEEHIASDVIEIDINEAVRLVDAQQREAFRTLPLLLGLKAQVSETELNLVCDLVELKRKEQLQESTQENSKIYKMDAADVPLEEANLIMSLGGGVADISLFLACADALGATVGGSRVVVDEGKLPREKQVGATGKTTQASVYLAFGISGAIQHLEGIKNCQTVVAVNTDESCAMVARADVSYINDAVSVLAALKHLVQHESTQDYNAD